MTGVVLAAVRAAAGQRQRRARRSSGSTCGAFRSGSSCRRRPASDGGSARGGSCTRKALDERGRVRRLPGRADALCSRLPAGPHRRPQLAAVRPRIGRRLQSAALARRARHRRRPGRPRRPVRVRKVARPPRGSRARAQARSAPVQGDVRGSGTRAKRSATSPSRLLIRTAANAYFPQVVSALSLPDNQTGLAEDRCRALGRSRDRR